MTPERMEAALSRRLARHRRIQGILLEAFETRERTYGVRRSELVEYAARRLRQHAHDHEFILQVHEAAQALGWRYVRPGNNPIFRCCKRRIEADADALARTRLIGMVPL